MSEQPYECISFEHKGRETLIEPYYDNDMGPPWKEHDGHGPVRERTKDEKRPWERLIGTTHAYDWRAAMKMARDERWGFGIDDFMALMCKLRRVPTKKQLVEHAVQRDFDYLKGWCDDDWHWVCIKVIDVKTGVSEYLGGIESSNEDYILSCAHDLAEEFYEQVVWATLSGEQAA